MNHKIYPTLREATVARQAEWANGVSLSVSYKANELFGEAGEAANVIKKLERERLGIAGSRSTLQDLADELADVEICVDLLALELGIPAITPWMVGEVTRLNRASGVARLGHAVGRVCALIEQAEAVGVIHAALESVVLVAELIAAHEDIDLDHAIARKFNATSDKVGLTTRLAA